MFDQLVIRLKTRQFRLYNESFSFFHSNSINKILTSKKIDQVILFRDLQFFDNETEYLKRAYYESQAYTRIKKLINYYEKNMTPPSPSLLTLQQYQYLDSRNRKILKLCIMKQKSQGQKEKRKSFIQSNGLKGSNTSCVEILPKLDETNLSNIADSERYESQQESYDSDVHNVFSDFKDKAKSLFASVNDMQSDYRQLLYLRNIKESQLIINFKTVNEPQSDFNNCENEHKINVIEISRTFSGSPLKFNKTISKEHQQPLQQQINFKTSYRNQPLEQSNLNYQQNIVQIQKEHEQPIQSCFQSGSFGMGYQQLKNQVQGNNNLPLMTRGGLQQQAIGFPKNAQSLNGLSSKNDTENIPLISHSQANFNNPTNSNSKKNNQHSDSMSPHVNQSNNPTSKANSQSSNSKNPLNNAISPVKKGKLSFMEYYHSVPVKNPTNILEKYIKRKK